MKDGAAWATKYKKPSPGISRRDTNGNWVAKSQNSKKHLLGMVARRPKSGNCTKGIITARQNTELLYKISGQDEAQLHVLGEELGWARHITRLYEAT